MGYNIKKIERILTYLASNPPGAPQDAVKWVKAYDEVSQDISESQMWLEIKVCQNNTPKNRTKLINDSKKIDQVVSKYKEHLLKIICSSPFSPLMFGGAYKKIINDLTFRSNIILKSNSNFIENEFKLVQNFKFFSQNLSTNFNGKQTLLSVISGYMKSESSQNRFLSFKSYWETIKINQSQFQKSFDDLLTLRINQSKNAKYENCVEYYHHDNTKTSYSRNDIKKYRQSISQYIPKIIESMFQVSKLKKTAEHIEQLKPWNLGYSNFYIKNNNISINDKDFFKNIENILESINPVFNDLFLNLKKHKLLDIKSRKNKMSGAFSATLHKSKSGFVFANLGTNFNDIFTFLHELGHSFHAQFFTHINPFLGRQPCLEICETVSFCFELLGSKHIQSEQPLNASRQVIFKALHALPHMALVDHWQEIIYTNEIFDWNERNKIWEQLSKQYRPYIQWGEFEEYEKYGWMSCHHVFTHPFYYFEYIFAYYIAFQLFFKSLNNHTEAVENLISVMSMGGLQDFPGLCQILDVDWEFKKEPFEKCVNDLNVFMNEKIIA